jgi:quinol monooxygenase YgiN
MAKIVIAAQIDIDAARREEALTSGKKWIDGALTQDGCLRYDWSADGNRLARINVFEEWASEQALARHFAGPQYAGMRDHIGRYGIINAQSAKYRIDAEAAVYDASGKPTENF